MAAGGEGAGPEAGWSRGDWIVALWKSEEKFGWRDCFPADLLHFLNWLISG